MKALETFRLFTTILSDSIDYGEHVADEVRTKNVCLLGHGAIAPLSYLEQNGATMPVHLANANAVCIIEFSNFVMRLFLILVSHNSIIIIFI